MLYVDNENVYLTRGDSCDLIITIRDIQGDIYELQAGDILTFTIKVNCNTEDIIIQKVISTNVVSITPADTEKLAYGAYWYDVQLTTSGEDIYTVIPPHRFNITPEVTFNGGE